MQDIGSKVGGLAGVGGARGGFFGGGGGVGGGGGGVVKMDGKWGKRPNY